MVTTKSVTSSQLKIFTAKLKKYLQIADRDIPTYQAADRFAEERIVTIAKTKKIFKRVNKSPLTPTNYKKIAALNFGEEHDFVTVSIPGGLNPEILELIEVVTDNEDGKENFTIFDVEKLLLTKATTGLT